MLDSTLNDERVVCLFNAKRVQSIFNKFHGNSNTTFVVYLSQSVVTIQTKLTTTDVPAESIVLGWKNNNEVSLYCQAPKSTVLRYVFSTRLEAIEFIGAVQLAQHIHFLRCEKPKSTLIQEILSTQLKQTLEYAQEMWNMDLWQKSYTFYDFVEVLEAASRDVQCDTIPSIRPMLEDLCKRFATQATFDKQIEVEGMPLYSISPVTLLLAKVKALEFHCTL